VAAIRAAQNGLKTACLDNWKNYDGTMAFGGTCLNAGCIPSKALLESSELFHRANAEFAVHGIGTGEVTIDIAAMQKRKAGIVKQLTGGITALFKANKVHALQGTGRYLGDGKVEFTPEQGEQEILAADHVVLATGSQPFELPGMPFDGENIVDSWGALEFDAVPGRLGVIGGGVIGLELGSVWSRLGSEVTILEAMDDFLFMADRQIAKEAQRLFKRQGLDIRLGAMVQQADRTEDGIALTYTDGKGEQSLTVDKVVVAVGRRPYTDGLLAEGTGVELDERGSWADAGAQGVGRGRDGCGSDRRRRVRGQLRCHPVRHLYGTGDCLGRQDRRGGQGGRDGRQSRDVLVRCQRPCERNGAGRRDGQDDRFQG
jgi:dihydrolipoamide dehydrogenase